MSEQSREPRSSVATAALALAIVVVLPVIYVLSLGPVIWLTAKLEHESINEAARFVYAPLIWLHHHSEVARELLDWYVDFWE